MVVVDYNREKCAVDLSDQMIAYSTAHRRTKWYIKLALELLLNTSISNAMILYKQAIKRKINVSDFRMALAMHTVPFTRAVKGCDTKCRRKKGERIWHENFAECAIKKNVKQLGSKIAKNRIKKCFNTVHR